MTVFPSHTFRFFGLWIPAVLYFVPLLAVVILRKGVFHRTVELFSSRRSRREYFLFITSKMIMLGYLFYSFAIPLHSSVWFFRAGGVLYLTGYLLYVSAWVTVASAEKGTVFSSGLYRYSRHPIYVSSALLFTGTGLLSGSWVFLMLSVIVSAMHLYNGYAEERICEEVFGDEYREYASRTPRWIGLPGKKAD